MLLSIIVTLLKSLPNLLQLSLTGGEPSLRKDLPEVVKIFCDISKVAKCSIITNGMLTERVIGMVKEILTENKNTSLMKLLETDQLSPGSSIVIKNIKDKFYRFNEAEDLIAGEDRDLCLNISAINGTIKSTQEKLFIYNNQNLYNKCENDLSMGRHISKNLVSFNQFLVSSLVD